MTLAGVFLSPRYRLLIDAFEPLLPVARQARLGNPEVPGEVRHASAEKLVVGRAAFFLSRIAASSAAYEARAGEEIVPRR